MNGTTPRHVIPRERKRVEGSSQVAGFILWWFFIQRGGFLHSADAAVGMTNLRGGFVSLHRLSLQRFPERHIGRSLRFRWWVVPFNRTGSICNAHGTAHRPFPTVSLKGITFNQRSLNRPFLCSPDFICNIAHTNNCPLSTVN